MGRGNIYTNKEDILEYAKEHYPKKTYKEIANHFSCSESLVRSISKPLNRRRPIAVVGEERVFNLKAGPRRVYKSECGQWLAVDGKGGGWKKHVYTENDILFVKSNVGEIPTKDIAAKIGVSSQAIIRKIRELRALGDIPPKRKRIKVKVKRERKEPIKKERKPRPVKAQKVKKPPKVKKVKPKKVKVYTAKRAVKKVEKVMQTRVIDNSRKVKLVGRVLGQRTETYAMPGKEKHRAEILKMVDPKFYYPGEH